jgi:hypothetical protein
MTISPNKWELDVQGYLNVCNISAATPRQQIRDFSKGVNDLGLWNSMVCWPLRSSQNYGSGTTAFSLGGLGTYNGSLENGPTWGTSGVSFVTASSTRITTSLLPSSEKTFFAAYQHAMTGVATVGSVVGQRGNQGVRDPQVIAVITAETIEGALCFGGENALYFNILTGPTFVGGEFSDSNNTIKATRNGASLVSGGWTGVNSTGAVNIGAMFSGGGDVGPAYFNGTIAAAMVFEGLRIGQSAQLYTLYKETLGTGLSLP